MTGPLLERAGNLAGALFVCTLTAPASRPDMPRYRAYELSIDSQLELPGLPPDAAGGPPDVEVVEGDLADADMACAEDGSRIGAYYFDVARFLLDGGRRIVVDVRRDVGEEEVVARLLGEIFATLLRQRGLLVLHACAVERDGRAVAVVGESGWGKSTLAEAFCQRGYALVTDDVMAVSFEADRPTLVASYPQIRLRQDSASFLVPDGRGLEEIERNGPKLARNGVRLSESGPVLDGLYFIEPRFAPAASTAPIDPAQALMGIVQHTRARTLIQTNTPGLLRDHLHLCGQLVRQVPPRLLRRRRSFEALPEAIEAVERDAWPEPARPEAA